MSSHRFDVTLGAGLLGNTAAAMLYGVTSVQIFIYFRCSSSKDGRIFKSVIGLLWLLDTLHMALVAHGAYHYLILNFMNPKAIQFPVWSLLSQIYVTSLSDLVVRSIFGYRVWMMSGHNKFLAIIIATTSLYVTISGFVFTSLAFKAGTFDGFSPLSWLLYSGFAFGVVADGIIAVSLCILLKRSRTGFKRTDSLVTVLMVYTINTGLLTSLCTAAVFITYAIWPHTFIFIGIYFGLSKMYLNSLLATLNARPGLSSHGISDMSNIDSLQKAPTGETFAFAMSPFSQSGGTDMASSSRRSHSILEITVDTKHEQSFR